MSAHRIPVFFNEQQLSFKPIYEWAFGERIDHPETTARAESILGALTADGAAFEVRDPVRIPREDLRALHSYELLTLYETARRLPEGETFYPTVFPKRPGDPSNLHHAGAFCFDAATPLNAETWAAAAWSAACAKAAAVALETPGTTLTYGLSRPPGHHATHDLFGGYCYFNNAGVAARHFVEQGSRVVVLDIDFHHGNGTQSLFYLDPRVLVISIHGDPREFFPFFAGFADETGEGAGRGYNLNLPLAAGCDLQGYREVLENLVIGPIRNFGPDVFGPVPRQGF